MLQDKSGYDFCACISTREELLKFALAVHEDGYNKGYEDGVNMMRNLEDYND